MFQFPKPCHDKIHEPVIVRVLLDLEAAVRIVTKGLHGLKQRGKPAVLRTRQN